MMKFIAIMIITYILVYIFLIMLSGIQAAIIMKNDPRISCEKIKEWIIKDESKFILCRFYYSTGAILKILLLPTLLIYFNGIMSYYTYKSYIIKRKEEEN